MVWQNTVVLAGATVGSECNLNCFCFVENDVHIGNRVTVKSGVYLWDGMTVEDEVFIGPNATFTNHRDPRSKTPPSEFDRIVLKKGCSVGANATVIGPCTVGVNALVAAGAVVTKDVPDNVVVAAIPPEFFDGDEGPFLNLERLHADLDAELKEAFCKVLAKQAFIKGPEVDGFEREFATWTTSEFAVGTSNGLDALTLALRALNVGPGDEVVMPANTFIATALAVSQLDAQPVLVDVCPDTALMDPAKLQDALGPSTKVVVPVHLYGQACGMTSISELAWDCGASIVEDNAQAQGASWDGTTGSWGDVQPPASTLVKTSGPWGTLER